MNLKIKLSIALVMSLMLIACGGGSSSKPVKMVKVWKNVKEVEVYVGKVSEIITNTYDKNGFLIKKEIDKGVIGQSEPFIDGYNTYGYTDGVLSKKTEYLLSGDKIAEESLDGQGTITERVSYKRDGMIRGRSIYVSTYDDKKRVIREELFYEIGGDIRRVIIFTYNNGIETHKYDIDMDGETDDATYIFTHNDSGELIKQERYNKNQELVRREEYTYEYDENNNIQTKSILINGYTIVTTYTWEERSVPENYAK